MNLKMNALERKLDCTEACLRIGSLAPGVNLVIGPAKVVLGIAQTIRV